MTTIQEPQYRTRIQAPPQRYYIPLQLCYKATSKQGPLYGFGRTRTMSSQDITFAPSGGLKPGMNAEIAIAWPLLLDGRIRLQLVLEATITDNQNGVAEASILTYHFRTCRPTEAGSSGGPVCASAEW